MKSILESISDLIQEGLRFKKVVRGGKILKKLMCPPGYKSTNGRCVRMSSMEIRKRKKSAKLMLKTKKRTLKGMNAIMLNKRRAKSLLLRKRRGLR
jgi:hypothetical protein